MCPSPRVTTCRRSSGSSTSSGSRPPNRQRSRRDGSHQPSRPRSARSRSRSRTIWTGPVVPLAEVHHPVGRVGRAAGRAGEVGDVSHRRDSLASRSRRIADWGRMGRPRRPRQLRRIVRDRTVRDLAAGRDRAPCDRIYRHRDVDYDAERPSSGMTVPAESRPLAARNLQPILPRRGTLRSGHRGRRRPDVRPVLAINRLTVPRPRSGKVSPMSTDRFATSGLSAACLRGRPAPRRRLPASPAEPTTQAEAKPDRRPRPQEDVPTVQPARRRPQGPRRRRRRGERRRPDDPLGHQPHQDASSASSCPPA